MRTVWREEFESGDKVRLVTNWYAERGLVEKDEILIVQFQDGDEVWTNKGIFDFDELELVEE